MKSGINVQIMLLTGSTSEQSFDLVKKQNYWCVGLGHVANKDFPVPCKL